MTKNPTAPGRPPAQDRPRKYKVKPVESVDRTAPSPTASAIRPCEIHVDEEGNWFHGRNPIIREDIIELLLGSLRLAPDGLHLIEWSGTVCALDVADTAFVVARVDRIPAGEGAGEQILLTLKHFPHPEPLDGATLWVGRENILYCRVRDGRLPARFSRPAYYQLAQWIEEDAATGEFYIEINGRRFPLGTEKVL